MELEIICTDTGLKFDYNPIIITSLVFWKNRTAQQMINEENLREFEAMDGVMFAYPSNPEFGLSKIVRGDTPLYTNGQVRVKSIKVINQ